MATDPPASSQPDHHIQHSYARRIAKDVIMRWGARIGLVWIGVLVILAVFAPILANSHPLLLSQAGHIQSPMLAHLSAVDLSLLITALLIPIILLLNRLLYQKLFIIIAFLLTSLAITHSVVHPPALVVYEQYREAQARGEYDWVIRAPIPYSPKDYLRDYGDTGLEAPISQTQRIHLFGTEENGADVLSRMIHAARIALAIGFIATGIALSIGVIIGGLMGYFSGIVDMIGMRLVEIFEAIPTLFLLLTFVAFFGRSLYMMMFIIGITSWSGYARYVRAEFLKLRGQEYVQAAVACGLPLHFVLFRHMLPNAMAPVLVAASFGVASAILAEATLSFLGLGLIDDPSWGQMLNQAVQASTFNWWMAVFPGGAIFLTVFAYNLIGESLRDALDPHVHRK